MVSFAEHPLRHALVNEVHARPFEQLTAPVRASHIALLSDESELARDRRHVAALCERFGLPTPGEDAKHYAGNFDRFRCKWERHTEFATYTFFEDAPFEAPFADPPIERVPQDWLEAMPGELLVACHLALAPGRARKAGKSGSGNKEEPDLDDLQRHFGTDSLTGSRMSGGNAEAWTDFRLHEDGFARILVRDVGLHARQAGRLVQRLLEIETYRLLALLALPLAREAAPEISAAARRLAEITGRMASIDGLEDERAMLGDLTQLAGRLEQLVSRNAYRFSAASAYYALVETRMAELREQRIEGTQTIREFMDRRMAPAIRTCEATAARQDRLAERLARATVMLRARVDIALEAQNRDLLRSMNRRARLQLRLQETVEGLSVAAISYYLVGLVAYAAKGVESAGVPVPVDLVTGLAIPVVLLGVWSAVRRIRRRLVRDNGN